MANPFLFDFTDSALENIAESGIDWRVDLAELQRGVITPERLLAECLNQADPDREKGWRDYVAELTRMARLPSAAELEDMAACTAEIRAEMRADERRELGDD